MGEIRKTAVALRGGVPRGSGAHAAPDGSTAAPVVAATGRGYVAEEIVRLAERHGVPVERDPILVTALSQLQLGQVIPPELYQVVAELLVFLYDLDLRQNGDLDPDAAAASRLSVR